MQSVVLYGRLLARVIVSGVNTELPTPWRRQGDCASRFSHTQRELRLITASSGISKNPQSAEVLKKWAFGDDACFVVRQSIADVIGVADGVGGWRSYGVDPSLFSTSLMQTCERLVKEGKFHPQKPKDILANSYEEILESKEAQIGSCTACLVSLSREEKKVYTANLGDSGYLVIRHGKVIERSQEQQHYFNTPFQLSVAPSTLQGLVIGDSPDSAESHSFGVEEGDMILVGTDGLFDNMDDNMILDHVKQLKDATEDSIQSVANSIVEHCRQLAADPEYMSPFARNAVANGFGADITGGKPDDITVLLARVASVNKDLDSTDTVTSNS